MGVTLEEICLQHKIQRLLEQLYVNMYSIYTNNYWTVCINLYINIILIYFVNQNFILHERHFIITETICEINYFRWMILTDFYNSRCEDGGTTSSHM